MKEEVGTGADSDDLRNRINAKQAEMTEQHEALQTAINSYGNISVPYRAQAQQ